MRMSGAIDHHIEPRLIGVIQFITMHGVNRHAFQKFPALRMPPNQRDVATGKTHRLDAEQTELAVTDHRHPIRRTHMDLLQNLDAAATGSVNTATESGIRSGTR